MVDISIAADIKVHVSWNWNESIQSKSNPIGRDQLLIYYFENGYYYCELDGGDRAPVSRTQYTSDFSFVKCVINADEFDVPQNKIHQILRMLPIRQMLLHKNILFLHASQILYKDLGIVFSAPSGTGKTTQAKLWRKYRNAEIICNDRTLLKEVDGKWNTYGYPYDGSEPVANNKINTLSCIVLLQKSNENKIVQLNPAKAISLLMKQVVIDGWDSISCKKAIDLIVRMFEIIPVYLLSCTVSEEAVAVLEEKLGKEESENGKSI